MKLFKRAYCRAFQLAFRAALPILPYKMPTVLNKVTEIPKAAKSEGLSKLLLVTDKMILKLSLLDPLTESLEAAGIDYCVYSELQPNPTIANVEAAREIYLREHCEGLIAFGGGSAIDCAKGVAARIARPRKTLQKMRGIIKVRRRTPIVFAVATTAGTGSETTVACVLVNDDTRHGDALNDFVLSPRYAVLDPSLTKTLPSFVAATTGLDALTHAVEAYIGRSTTKETRQDALSAIRLIYENISPACTENDDAARANMLRASHLAGRAFSKSYVGYVHAVAHSLGGQYGIAHGFANAVLLPIVLEMYGSVIHKKLYDIALSAGVADESDEPSAAALKFIASIYALLDRFDIPRFFPQIKTGDIPAMAKKADREANPLYPVPILMDAVAIEKIYYKVMSTSGKKRNSGNRGSAEKILYVRGNTAGTAQDKRAQ